MGWFKKIIEKNRSLQILIHYKVQIRWHEIIFPISVTNIIQTVVSQNVVQGQSTSKSFRVIYKKKKIQILMLP